MADLRAPGALDSPEALVPLARSGDRRALARIVRLHRADMAGVAYVVTGDEGLALEAVRRAWPVASRRLGGLRDPARLGPWLCAIAAREALGLARRPSRARSNDGHGPGDPALEDALRRLSPVDRALVALRHLAGASPEEIAGASKVREADVPARVVAVEALLDPTESPHLAERLRTFAAIPLPPVDIDAEAHRAILTRNDHRIRVASLAVAIAVTVIVVSFSYVVGPPPLPPGLGTPAPSASPSGASPTPVSDA